MLTEPIGPRSPDDILAAVYQRTERARRQRRQRLTAAVAVVALGVAGFASLRVGGEDESRVHTVDRGKTTTEEAAPPTTTVAPVAVAPARATKGAPRRQSPAPAATDSSRQASTPPTTQPPMPTATTLPIDEGSQTKLLLEASDADDDAVLPGWWYEIVSGSMQLDFGSRLVVFTTQYGTPDGSGNRDNRTLHTEFVYAEDIVNIDVTETDNVLGTVMLGANNPCNACSKSLDEVGGRLTVGVPIDVMNDYMARRYGSGHTIEQAVVTDLKLKTISAGLTVTAADESGDAP